MGSKFLVSLSCSAIKFCCNFKKEQNRTLVACNYRGPKAGLDFLTQDAKPAQDDDASRTNQSSCFRINRMNSTCKASEVC